MLRSLQSDASEARELKARLKHIRGQSGARERMGSTHTRTLQVAPEEALAVANHNADKPFPNAEEIETKLSVIAAKEKIWAVSIYGRKKKQKKLPRKLKS